MVMACVSLRLETNSILAIMPRVLPIGAAYGLRQTAGGLSILSRPFIRTLEPAVIGAVRYIRECQFYVCVNSFD